MQLSDNISHSWMQLEILHEVNPCWDNQENSHNFINTYVLRKHLIFLSDYFFFT